MVPVPVCGSGYIDRIYSGEYGHPRDRLECPLCTDDTHFDYNVEIISDLPNVAARN